MLRVIERLGIPANEHFMVCGELFVALVPDGHLVAGVPARIVRPLREEELELLRHSAAGYVKKIPVYLPEGEE